ncbi:hypothetical protein IKG73_02565 [Candidatus Saccharibacteria bacterium]|nr:hypothetical protein [Candidatus Saccharibacteria bacterium]
MKIKNMIAGVAIAIAGMFAVSAPAIAATCPTGTQHAGEEMPSIAQCNMPKDDTTVQTDNLWNTVQTIINWVLAVLGLVTVVMIIIGGFTYLTSQGDPGKTKKGRDTILYGVIGLIIALLAFAIVNFVLTNVFGGSSTGSDQSSTGGIIKITKL